MVTWYVYYRNELGCGRSAIQPGFRVLREEFERIMAENRFVISIAREREARAGDSHATITVDVSGGRARATELSVRAGKGGSVDLASLPVVDVLMRALAADEAPATRAAPATRDVPAVAVAAAAETAPATRSRRRSSGAAAPAAGGRRGKRAAAATDTGRAYRRMPEPDDVLAAYQEVGTVSGLADHFGVPLHTVKGWARRLRQMGYQFER
jgi:hypothetical protein